MKHCLNRSGLITKLTEAKQEVAATGIEPVTERPRDFFSSSLVARDDV